MEAKVDKKVQHTGVVSILGSLLSLRCALKAIETGLVSIQ